ncbi:hypothetical protein [Roseateles sp.]|uniref:hypothetical protein n=1 Tax=Roseateles sp. TaxID=1971397 RepID=UPI0031CE9B74
MTNENNQLDEHTFQVIEGGATGDGGSPDAHRPRVRGYATAYANAEEDRLRQAILRIRLPKVRTSVEEALAEWVKLNADVRDHRAELRKIDLAMALEHLGLMHNEEHHEPARWNLARPEWLLESHPELAALYPNAHDHMVVRWDDQ